MPQTTQPQGSDNANASRPGGSKPSGCGGGCAHCKMDTPPQPGDLQGWSLALAAGVGFGSPLIGGLAGAVMLGRSWAHPAGQLIGCLVGAALGLVAAVGFARIFNRHMRST
jgi:hypothetical protein